MTKSQARWWPIVVGVGAVVAATASIVLFANAYANRNPDYSCAVLQVDAESLGIDAESLYSEGSWNWWPPGLRCTFSALDGGRVTVGPDPSLSVVLALALVGTLAVLTGLAGLAGSHRRRLGGTPSRDERNTDEQ